jgi:hypothetical protein
VPKPDLTGVLLKLDRAYEHLDVLGDEITAFSDREPAPFGFRTEKTPRGDEGVEYVLYAVIREKPPPEFSLIIGDVVQNLRSALDHLVYALAPPKVRRKRQTQFPIFTDECRFKVLSPPMIEGIAGDERTLLERVQPYNATNVPDNDPLAILNKLSNLDKHRLLIPTIAAISEMSVWIASSNADIKVGFLNGGPVEHGAKIVGFTATPKDPTEHMQVQPQSGLQVRLADTGATYQIPAFDLLEMIHHHIRHSIIERWFSYGIMPRKWDEISGAAE